MADDWPKPYLPHHSAGLILFFVTVFGTLVSTRLFLEQVTLAKHIQTCTKCPGPLWLWQDLWITQECILLAKHMPGSWARLNCLMPGLSMQQIVHNKTLWPITSTSHTWLRWWLYHNRLHRSTPRRWRQKLHNHLHRSTVQWHPIGAYAHWHHCWRPCISVEVVLWTWIAVWHCFWQRQTFHVQILESASKAYRY